MRLRCFSFPNLKLLKSPSSFFQTPQTGAVVDRPYEANLAPEDRRAEMLERGVQVGSPKNSSHMLARSFWKKWHEFPAPSAPLPVWAAQ